MEMKTQGMHVSLESASSQKHIQNKMWNQCFSSALYCLKFNVVLSNLQWAGCYINMKWGLDSELQYRFTPAYHGVHEFKLGLNYKNCWYLENLLSPFQLRFVELQAVDPFNRSQLFLKIF